VSIADKAAAPAVVEKAEAPLSKAPATTGEVKSADMYTNAQGVVTQATLLTAADNLAMLSIGLGTVAKDGAGNPLSSVSITSRDITDLVAIPDRTLEFAGIAYELGPDLATFSPAVPLTFTLPQARWGKEYTVNTYNAQTSTWSELPTSFDPATGRITAQLSHFSCFALFARTQLRAPGILADQPLAPVPETTIVPPPPTAMSIFSGMIQWVSSIMAKNIYMVAGIVILACALLYIRGRRGP
jgi:hypothetical protein